MITLVTGGSGSGKSAYAEEEIVRLGERRRIYIATMKPWDEECRRRIERHRVMRAGKQFDTIECYRSLEQLKLPEGREANAVLLECLSNLVSNELFGTGEDDDPESISLEYGTAVADSVVNGVISLKRQAADLVIVTNEVFSAGDHRISLTGPEDSTALYLRVLGNINCRLGAAADRVIEVTAGIPFAVKGNLEKNIVGL